MNRFRAVTVAAVSVSVSGLALVGAIAPASAANADVGEIIVHQLNAEGQTVCAQSYIVANLLAPETITDDLCQGTETIEETNLTLEPVEVIIGDPEDYWLQSGQTASYPGVYARVGSFVNWFDGGA